MFKILMGVAFGCSFAFMFLGVILFIHLDKTLGVMLFIIGGIYFFKYLPSNKNNKEYLHTIKSVKPKIKIWIMKVY